MEGLFKKISKKKLGKTYALRKEEIIEILQSWGESEFDRGYQAGYKDGKQLKA